MDLNCTFLLQETAYPVSFEPIFILRRLFPHMKLQISMLISSGNSWIIVYLIAVAVNVGVGVASRFSIAM